MAIGLRFDAPLGEQASLSDRVCYRPLLECLLRAPVRVNLILGGHLLDAWRWFDPDLIDRVRTGLREDRFRLLASTYAQNLLLPSDDWDNRQQIRLHARLLEDLFGVMPAVFWSPGSTWRPDLHPVLADCGFRILPLDSRSLQAAGARPGSISECAIGGRSLRLLGTDDAQGARLLRAVWYHDPEAFLSAWRAGQDQTSESGTWTVIGEEADAFGLWAYRRGLDPRADLEGLSRLLAAMADEPGLDCAFLEDAAAGTPEPIGEVAPGWSRRLDAVLSDPDAPQHEEGYPGWEDFRTRAPKLHHFHRIYGAIRHRLQTLGQTLQADPVDPPAELDSSAKQWYRLAVRVFCQHQHRFGMPGAGGRGNPAWEGVGAAMTVACAAEMAASPAKTLRPVIDDVTGDGEDEVLLREGSQLAVLTPNDGRLLFWGDLAQGRLFVGNPSAVPDGRLQMDALAPELADAVEDWLPDDSPVAEPVTDERGWARFRWLDGRADARAEELPVWPRPMNPVPRAAMPARRRAFNDFVSLDHGPMETIGHHMDFRLEDSGATFLRFFHYRVELVKRVRLTSAGVRVTYRFRNVTAAPVRLHLRVVSELSPDGQVLPRSRGRILEPVRYGSRRHPGVVNTETGSALVLHSSCRTCEPATLQPAVFAWELSQVYDFSLDPGRTRLLTFRLNVYSADRLAAARQPSAR